MDLTFPIPDDLAARLGNADEVARRALEAFAAEEHRAGRLTSAELRRLLESRREAFGKSTPNNPDAASRASHGTSPVTSIRAFRVGKTLGGLDPSRLIREGRR